MYCACVTRAVDAPYAVVIFSRRRQPIRQEDSRQSDTGEQRVAFVRKSLTKNDEILRKGSAGEIVFNARRPVTLD